MASLWLPTPRKTPDSWAFENRVYPASSGVPGKRDPRLTPYMIQWGRISAEGTAKRTVMVCGAQMAKTETQLDVIGERLDTRPAPILYVGPSKEFNIDQFEPRLSEMFAQADTLRRKVAGGKRNKKTLKYVAGVRVRLAHAGSSTALKSDPASLALMDEIDEMLRNVKGQGDPLGLVEARGFTYADFTTMVASTPSSGVVDTEMDQASGLEFWRKAPPEDLESAIWRLFQDGTMYHWAWPCPECGEYFVPRRKLLHYPDNSSAARAGREAYIECPNEACKAHLFDDQTVRDGIQGTKAWMNSKGLHVCRGQWIEKGQVVGEPEDTNTVSFWVSGLCSPFVTWGERAESIVEAELSGEPQKIKVAINAGFGELYAPGGGDLPEWAEVLERIEPYAPGSLPEGVVYITAGIDVQGNGVYYVIRGWGARATSWKLKSGFLFGPTKEDDVWDALSNLLQEDFDGLPIKLAFIDSGFRPGDPKSIPVNMVYEFCRRHARFVFPTKGKDTQSTPLRESKIEVTTRGEKSKYGLRLFWLDSDYWKSWVHERVRWPADKPGAWFLDDASNQAYARQIVSEARTKGPSGRPVWVRRSRDNHYLDCEAMCSAAAFLLNAQHLRVVPKAEPTDPPPPGAVQAAPVEPPPPQPGTSPGTVGSLAQSATVNKYAKMAAQMARQRRP